MGGRAGLRLAGPQRPEVFSSESSLSLSTLPALTDLCLKRDEASLKPTSEPVRKNWQARNCLNKKRPIPRVRKIAIDPHTSTGRPSPNCYGNRNREDERSPMSLRHGAIASEQAINRLSGHWSKFPQNREITGKMENTEDRSTTHTAHSSTRPISKI